MGRLAPENKGSARPAAKYTICYCQFFAHINLWIRTMTRSYQTQNVLASISIKTRQCLAASLFALTAASASATMLTSNISMDNGFVAYIATSDNLQGTSFSSGNNWGNTFSDSVALVAGTDYFLHVYGYDQGGIAAFLGQFSLSGFDHQFSNGQTTLLTNASDWKANATGFADPFSAVTTVGQNGDGPWGTRPNIGAATWIWSGDPYTNDNSYFSTTILAASASVPEPESYALTLAALGGLVLSSRRKRAGEPG